MVDTRPMALERARKRAAERKAQRDALQENNPVQTAVRQETASNPNASAPKQS